MAITSELILILRQAVPEKTNPDLLSKLRDEVEHIQTVFNTMALENEELREHLLSCFSQGTHIRPDFQKDPNHWVYDHMCLSAYESAQELLIRLGMIKKEECSRS